MSAWSKLAIVAGGGDLPVLLARHCARTGQAYYVSRVAPFAGADLEFHPGASFGVGEIGARKAALIEAGCDAVVLAGVVRRPDFTTLVLDEEGRVLAPKLVAAARLGDDALLRAVGADFEMAGLRLVGAHEVAPHLLAPAGLIGTCAPDATARADIAKAAAVAAAIGEWDIGQAVAVCDGLVLAVEAQEGTDALIARIAALPEALRGSAARRRGVLLKRPKPIQERRIDLPTIGLATIEAAAAAGLAGVAVEAGGALILDKVGLAARADALGLFLIGFDPAAP